MSPELTILSITAATIGFIHTLLGPDHYLPFIVMAKTRKWSLRRTMLVTLTCGAGHIAGSMLLGMAGIILGVAATGLMEIESARGGLAAWMLIAFGLVYFMWGLRSAIRNRPHSHWHNHGDGHFHEHTHIHKKDHSHPHTAEGESNLTPWLLFVIFVLGPCEPLIPILMYPAAKNSFFGVLQVSFIFGLSTLITMLVTVFVLTRGLERFNLGRMERYGHSIAGATICVSGFLIQFSGL